MTEAEALSRMVPPGMRRPGKLGGFGGVIQIHLTRACDKACYGCTQGSNLAGKTHFMSPEHFEQAVASLAGYFGVVGIFGGNPALHPQFEGLCEILRKYIPRERRGLWCNHPVTPERARVMRETFNPAVCNLNVHLDRKAYEMFREHWPEARPFGLDQDSRHAPPFVAMRDVLRKPCKCVTDDFPGNHEYPYPPCPWGLCDGSGEVYDESRAWELISACPINQHWSAAIGVFRGQLRAWFCEIAMAQSILHQDEPDYPDTGIPVPPGDDRFDDQTPWWQYGMIGFVSQVRKHCHECSIPFNGYGALAQGPEDRAEQTSATHAAVYKPKRPARRVEVVTTLEQLGTGRLSRAIDYLQNAKR